MVGIDFEMPSCCANSSFEHCPFYNMCRHRETIRANFKPNDCPLVEAIPKDQYEARLKADMVAMLTELQLEIEDRCHYQSKDNPKLVIDADNVNTIIQQKINSLKENNYV